MRRLKMPDSFASVSLEHKDAVSEEVDALPVAAIVIEGWSPGGNDHPPSPLVQTHAAPVIHTACGLPGVTAPRIMPKLIRLGDRMEHPAELPRLPIEASNVARRGALPLGDLSPTNDNPVVYH